ncbi:MAG TPA: hypothetical protein VK668_15870 [Mucilaginibacter sp.]|nr:hypothetical protein [Mucilaginibacter sp.]
MSCRIYFGTPHAKYAGDLSRGVLKQVQDDVRVVLGVSLRARLFTHTAQALATKAGIRCHP